MKSIKIKNPNTVVAASAGIFFLAFDLISKAIVFSLPKQTVPFLGDFFYFSLYHMNDGIAFGIDLPIWVQVGGSVVFIGLLIQLAQETILKNKKHLFLPALLFGILIGGAMGNFISRIIQGYVIDFIVLKPIPIFNIADVGITVGIFGLFALNLFSPSFKISSEKKLHLKPKAQ